MFEDFDMIESYAPRKKVDKFSSHNRTAVSEEDIERIAKDLVDQKIDNKRYFGYISIDDSHKKLYNKYDKTYEIFVKYNDSDIISKNVMSWGEYTGHKSFEYYDEIK